MKFYYYTRGYCRTTLVRIQKQTLIRVSVFVVDGGGFEPPKAKLTDLQSVPFGHSGTRPYFW